MDMPESLLSKGISIVNTYLLNAYMSNLLIVQASGC